MSAAVTSFCRSTNCFGPRPGGAADGTIQTGSSGSSATSSAARHRGHRTIAEAGAAAPPRRRPRCLRPGTRRARRSRCTAPAERSACTDVPGTKHALASSNRALPPDCACRCTTGLQPPDIATRSQANRPRRDPRRRCRRHRASSPSTALTRRAALARRRRRHCRSPRFRQRAARSASAPSRRAARVDDRGDGDAGSGEVERRTVRAVVVGEHDRARPGMRRRSDSR